MVACREGLIQQQEMKPTLLKQGIQHHGPDWK